MTPAPHFTQFGKYEIVRKLGRSLTDVYLALDPDLNRRVVLKIIEQCRDSFTELIVEAERRGASIQQLLHSADARILEVYDFGDLNGCFFVAMQYAEGRSLAELLQRDKRLDPQRAAHYAAEVCSQLATLHAFQTEIDGQRRAVVHGDIKPSNLQIGPNDEVWLLDFGIAKCITETRNLTAHNLGSPSYCSPERLRKAQVDPFADLWAVGVCLYECVAGMPPYQAQTTRKLENLIQSRRPPRALPESCPAALKAIIWKALSADLERRYSSASAFQNDLKAFLAGRPTVAEAESNPAWDANATIEKAKPQTVRERVRIPARVARLFTNFHSSLWPLAAGVAVGLLLFIPATYAHRFWNESAPLRWASGYARLSTRDLNSNWELYKKLEAEWKRLGRFSPVSSLTASLRDSLERSANEVLTSYRNSPDGKPESFDWENARVSFNRLRELEPANAAAKAGAAICEGYLKLQHDAKSPKLAESSFREAQRLAPSSPDPHLGLARVYVYGFHNVGMAVAEMHTAERLGYHLGPREFEQQADGYLYRAEQEVRAGQQAKNVTEKRRLWSLAQRDFDRARSLYEPIAGFSNVGFGLERLDRDEAMALKLQTVEALNQASRKKVYPRYRRWR